MGALYLRGNVWWIKYYRNGKPYRESTKTTKKMKAEQVLKQREGEIASGKIPGICFERIRFDELADDFLSDYRVNGRKTIAKAERSVKHLKTVFEGVRVPDITTPRINAFVEARQAEGAENGTINRELAALKRILNLGARQTPPKVDRVPFIPMLKENNVRQGFFDHGHFLALRDSLPAYLKPFVTFAYKTGWRFQEVSNLQWAKVDLQGGTVRLEAGTTKNDEARTVCLDNELQEIFNTLHEARKNRDNVTPYVFTNEGGTDRIRDIRGSWERACRDAKIGRRLFHDLRRTAVRNMVRAGVPERVAMMVSGHKTRSVFDRYNIVSDTDLKLAAQRQETYLRAQNGHISGTVTKIQKKRGQAVNA